MRAKKNSALSLITIGMIIIGFLGMGLIKSYQTPRDANVTDASLPNLLQLELENEQLAKENAKLWEELAKIQAGQSAAALASEQIEEASINAGLVPLTGLGIVITLDDSDY